MAIAVDASSPARVSGNPNNDVDLSTASFTPPGGDIVLVACVSGDTNANENITVTLSDSIGGTSGWVQQIEADEGTETGGGGGHSSIWTKATTGGSALTVGVQREEPAGEPNDLFLKVYVITGHDTATPVDSTNASNRGSNANNQFTTDSVTPGADGLLIVAADDWNARGAPTSSDLTEDAFSNSDLSGLSGYKTVSSGVSANADVDGSGALACDWQWCQIVVREGVTEPPVATVAWLTA